MSRVVWEERPILHRPAAVIAFEGWGDAGECASGAVRSLLDAADATYLGSIDPDEFFDFQVRRPTVQIDEFGMREIDWPDIEIWSVTQPGADRDLLVITGSEPHTRWKVFTAAVLEVLETTGVDDVVMLGAFIGQVPHTLPVPLVGSASDPELVSAHQLFSSSYEGPTGIVGVLTQAIGATGRRVVSVWAAVPHYVSQQEYPPGSLALLEKALEIVGVGFDTSDLTTQVTEFRHQLDEAMEDSEIREYIEDLETQSLAGESGIDPVDRLVEEIEDFLRDP